MTINKTMLLSLFVSCLLALALVGCDKDSSEKAPAGDSKTNTAKAEAQEPIQGHPDDWCGGHDLPESMCTKCNPELTASFKAKGDWCETHGFPESACPVCNPMKAPERKAAKGKTDDWCGEHAVPESMCTKCDQKLAASFKEKGDWCKPHGFPESVCPKCNPMEAPEKH